jgi:hypothetical protein
MEAQGDEERRDWADRDVRAERRQRRQDAERQRMPQHGRGMGVMVRNAIMRRLKEDQESGKKT